MSIPLWPSQERPREKLLQQGAKTLSDAELLAIFLRTGVQGKSAVDLGRSLLQTFHNLRGILEATPEAFCAQKGLGIAKYVQLKAAIEIAERYLFETIQRKNILKDAEDTKQFLTIHLRHQKREVFACLLLDTQHRVIHFEKLFFGTLATAHVYAREVVKYVLQYNAASVIFAHNHPSGITEPSLSDRMLTEQLKDALALIDVRVLDHFIIGEGSITSFAELGWL